MRCQAGAQIQIASGSTIHDTQLGSHGQTVTGHASDGLDGEDQHLIEPGGTWAIPAGVAGRVPVTLFPRFHSSQQILIRARELEAVTGSGARYENITQRASAVLGGLRQAAGEW